MIDLDDLEAKARAATPGPWKAERCNDDQLILEEGDSTGWRKKHPFAYIASIGGWGYVDHKNGEFIAAANPQTILELIGEMRELREMLKDIMPGYRLPWLCR